LGLWKGVGPTCGRATALAAAELATYDEVKQQFLKNNIVKEGLSCTLATAFVSGFVSTVASSPFDVVKSRVMGQPLAADGSGTLYSGMVDCFVKSAKNEGIMSLYNGFWPNFGRVGTLNIGEAARNVDEMKTGTVMGMQEGGSCCGKGRTAARERGGATRKGLV